MKSNTVGYFKPEICYCLACGSKAIGPWLVKSKGPIQFNLWRCNACRTGFMNPQPKREHLDAIYHKSGYGLVEPISSEEVIRLETEYPNATVDGERLVGTAKSFLAGKNGLKALDIGSGFGFFSRAAVQAGFEVMAVNPGKWENDIFKIINGFSPLPSSLRRLILKGKNLIWLFSARCSSILKTPWPSCRK